MKLKKWDIEKIYIENSYFMIKKIQVSIFLLYF